MRKRIAPTQLRLKQVDVVLHGSQNQFGDGNCDGLEHCPVFRTRWPFPIPIRVRGEAREIVELKIRWWPSSGVAAGVFHADMIG